MPRFLYVKVIKRELAVAWLFLFLVTVAMGIYHQYPTAVNTAALMSSEQQFDIVIDPGHGGIDPGAHAGGLTEKEIALDIALRLKALLENEGLSVGLTRDTDRDVSEYGGRGGTRHRRDLVGRLYLLNQGKLGLSIHVNAAKDESMQGAIVFYNRDSYVDQLYAQTVFEHLRKVQVMNHDFVVPRSNLMLLNSSRPPVLMVEIGFLTNQEDFQKLADTTFRDTVANALKEAILRFDYLRELEQTE